jgi:hypothetical protein
VQADWPQGPSVGHQWQPGPSRPPLLIRTLANQRHVRFLLAEWPGNKSELEQHCQSWESVTHVGYFQVRECRSWPAGSKGAGTPAASPTAVSAPPGARRAAGRHYITPRPLGNSAPSRKRHVATPCCTYGSIGNISVSRCVVEWVSQCSLGHQQGTEQLGTAVGDSQP